MTVTTRQSPQLANDLAIIAEGMREMKTPGFLEMAERVEQGGLAVAEACRLLEKTLGYLPQGSRMRRARVKRFLERFGAIQSTETV